MSKKTQRRKPKPSPWGLKGLRDLWLENYDFKNGLKVKFPIVDNIWPFNNYHFLNLQL